MAAVITDRPDPAVKGKGESGFRLGGRVGVKLLKGSVGPTSLASAWGTLRAAST